MSIDEQVNQLPPCPCHTNSGGRCVGVITNGVCTRCRRKFTADEVTWLTTAQKRNVDREEREAHQEI